MTGRAGGRAGGRQPHRNRPLSLCRAACDDLSHVNDCATAAAATVAATTASATTAFAAPCAGTCAHSLADAAGNSGCGGLFDENEADLPAGPVKRKRRGSNRRSDGRLQRQRGPPSTAHSESARNAASSTPPPPSHSIKPPNARFKFAAAVRPWPRAQEEGGPRPLARPSSPPLPCSLTAALNPAQQVCSSIPRRSTRSARCARWARSHGQRRRRCVTGRGGCGCGAPPTALRARGGGAGRRPRRLRGGGGAGRGALNLRAPLRACLGGPRPSSTCGPERAGRGPTQVSMWNSGIGACGARGASGSYRTARPRAMVWGVGV